MLSAAEFAYFDVSIVHRGASTYWLTVDCELGSLKALPVTLGDWGVDLAEARTPLEWLNLTVRRLQFAREDGRLIGMALMQLVFGQDAVRRLFAQMRAVATSSGRQVVVQILGAPDAVADWPWELMLDPDDAETPLALAYGVHLARMPKARSYATRPMAIEPPLNVLVIMSNPLDRRPGMQVESFDLYEEKRHLLRDLAPLVDAGLLQVDVEDRPRVNMLLATIRRRRRGYHVLHYLGHASPEGLWIEGPSGEGELLGSQRLTEMLRQNQDLKVAFFAGCETARAPDTNRPDDPDAGLSISHRVVRDAAPIVLGMQVVLPFHTQRLFTRAFYEALSAGHSVARAVHLARGAVWDGPDGHSRQLDWAIPTMFLGGAEPGHVLDPTAAARPRPQPHRIALRIAPEQRDLRFVARHGNLRRVIDVLSARKRQRLVCIRGQNVQPRDLSNLLDRAMEELDPGIAQLSFSARHLQGDPAEHLRNCFLDILRQTGWDSTRYDRAHAHIRDDVLLGQLVQTPLAVAVDHADSLPPDSAAVALLRGLIERRGRVNMAIVHPDSFNPFNAGLDIYSEASVVVPMTWSEVWNWVRGQLPDLARLGEDRVRALHRDLDDRLEDWEAFAAKLRNLPETQRAGMLNPAEAGRIGEETLHFSARRVAAAARDDTTVGAVAPVKISVAGPFTDGRDAAFVDAIGRFADAHGLPGSVGGSGQSGSAIVAQTQQVESPFNQKGTTDTARLLRWVGDVGRIQTDILVCDFGTPQEMRALSEMLGGMIAAGKLVFAAGGNSGAPAWPGWQQGVIAVGANQEGKPTDYSVYFADVGKPDIYAPESLTGTPLAGWVEDPAHRGTSFSALYAAAVAALVWANYRTLSALEVRAILIPRPEAEAVRVPVMLDVQSALERMAALKISDLLETDDMELMRLASEAGLPSDLVARTVDRMVALGTLVAVTEDTGKMYRYPARIASRYAAVRERPPGPERTDTQEDLMDDARDVARRRGLSNREARALWASDQLGPRILALASVYEHPEAANLEMLFDGIAQSRSAFEQFHAMRLAKDMVPDMTQKQQTRLRDILASPEIKAWFKDDPERQALSKAILSLLS